MRYYSRKVQPKEERYSTVKKECLAIKLAISEFWVYLLGRKFMIQKTDHRSLEWLDRLKESNPRLCHWSLSLHRMSEKQVADDTVDDSPCKKRGLTIQTVKKWVTEHDDDVVAYL